MEHLHFGVPQGSILKAHYCSTYILPIFVITSVIPFHVIRSIRRWYCALQTGTVKELEQNVANFNSSLGLMASWSLSLISPWIQWKLSRCCYHTSQMASFHCLKDENFNLEISNRQLEKSVKQKLLGVKFQENWKWNDHVKDMANASSMKCYPHCEN